MSNDLLFELVTHTPEETEEAGARLARLMESRADLPAFVALYGDLGAGKTAFVRGFASVTSPGSAVRSPTFALVNEYRRGARPVFHFDMYRIEDDDELYSSGFYDYESRGGYCLAEWCENIPWALPANRIRAEISKTGNTDERRITVEHINEKENAK